MSSYKSEGKAPMELLNPDFLRETAKALGVGEEKHADHHYLTDPVSLSKVIGATIRHLTQLLEENIDADTGLYHLPLLRSQRWQVKIGSPESCAAREQEIIELKGCHVRGADHLVDLSARWT